jgi:hypothetical protein
MLKHMHVPISIICKSDFSESGIGTDISSGEDHGAKCDQSERALVFTRQTAINESNLFSDAISTDVRITIASLIHYHHLEMSF